MSRNHTFSLQDLLAEDEDENTQKTGEFENSPHETGVCFDQARGFVAWLTTKSDVSCSQQHKLTC